MKNDKSSSTSSPEVGQSNLSKSKELALHYMKTLVEVARESFLILDANLKVISANSIFYQNFQVTPAETENKSILNLGNGQWDIPELKILLEKILPEKKVVKDYVVSHLFEQIGQKTIVLNARQIDSVQLIILAMEDISAKDNDSKKLVQTAKDLSATVVDRTNELNNQIKTLEILNKSMIDRELKMVELKKEIEDLKKQIKTGSSG